MSSILEVKKAVEEIILEIDEVIGIGISEDRENIIIYLIREEPDTHLKIPNRIGGYNVIKKVIGMLQPRGVIDRKSKIRPVVASTSCGHYQISAGTIGYIAIDSETKLPVILSNNHVIANVTTTKRARALQGDPVIQPGKADGGSETEDTVGFLLRWIPIDVDKKNIVDGAIAVVSTPYEFGILDEEGNVIEVKGLRTVKKGGTVYKYGRTTGKTSGKIVDVDFSGYVQYSTGDWGFFVDQILAEMEIDGGDSGSLLVDDEGYAVGLVFAGSENPLGKSYCMANKINSVFAMLDIELPSGERGYLDINLDQLSEPIGIDPLPILLGSILALGAGILLLSSRERKQGRRV